MLIGNTETNSNGKEQQSTYSKSIFFILQDITIIECYCTMRGYLCNNE